MQKVIAIFEGGRQAEGRQVEEVSNNDARAVTSSVEVNVIVGLLTEVCMRAQTLSEGDQRRVRDFVRTALSMLEATTALPHSDQTLFEAALRNAATRNG